MIGYTYVHIIVHTYVCIYCRFPYSVGVHESIPFPLLLPVGVVYRYIMQQFNRFPFPIIITAPDRISLAAATVYTATGEEVLWVYIKLHVHPHT